jgi:hypothetical protein
MGRGVGGQPVQFQPSSAEVIRAIGQRWLLKYWNHLRQQQAMPFWDQIDLHELKSVIEALNVYDVVRNGGTPRFLIQYQGAGIRKAYGHDTNGKFFEDILPPMMREKTLTVYRQALECRKPVYTINETRDRDGLPVQYERLLLPFTVGGHDVDRIVASLEMISPEGKFAQEDLLVTPVEPKYSVSVTISA